MGTGTGACGRLRHLIDLRDYEAESLASSLGLLSKYTSYVMVDTSGARAQSAAQTKVIPQMVQKCQYMVGDITREVEFGFDDYHDVPLFLRKQADDGLEGGVETGFEEALLDDLAQSNWQTSDWSVGYLVSKSLSVEFLEDLADIAEQWGYELIDALLVYLKHYLTNEKIRSKQNVERKLKKLTEHLPGVFIQDIAAVDMQ